MGSSVGPTRFVGRGSELARFEAALAAAAAGEATTVLLGGDAGVGKTRLMAECAGAARARGAQVWQGRCLELGDGGLPYAAVVELLDDAAEQLGVPTLHRLAGDHAGELARLLPALGEPAQAPDSELPLERSSQLRVFEAVRALLRRAAAERPLVVIVEDLHWADASTRDLLVFLAQRLRDAAVVLVATFRADELHRRHPLRPVLAQLQRSASVERLDLAAFDRSELAALVEAIVGGTPARELVVGLHERTGGNPFFVEELLAAGAADDDALPESLREVLLVSVATLPPEAMALLEITAAAGGHIRHGLLARVAGLDDEALHASLRRAVDHGALVAEPTSDVYGFRHELLAEVVYAALLPGERERHHADLAAALDGDGSLAVRSATAELAHHWHLAQDQPRSLAASVVAAREAEAAAGAAEALRHAERALQLWPQVDDAEARTRLGHAELLAWAAELAHLVGEVDRAVTWQERALAAEADDPTALAVMWHRLARFRWLAGDSDAAAAAATEAVRTLPSDADGARQAQVLAGAAQLRMLCLEIDDAATSAEQALALAREAGDRAVETNARITLGSCLAWQGHDRGVELLRQGRSLSQEIGADDERLRSYVNESNVLVHLGRFEEAITAAATGIEQARASAGGEERVGGILACNLAWPALLLGRWDLADEVLTAAPRATGGIGAGWVAGVRGQLLAARGELDAARTELDAARRAHADRNELSSAAFHRLRLRVAMLAGDTDHVAELIAHRPEVAGAFDEHLLELQAWLLQAAAEPAVGDRLPTGTADAVLADCHELAGRLPTNRGAVPAWVALADAEHARATGAPDAVDRWAAAQARCDELRLAYYAAYARYRHAEAVLAITGRRAGVRELLVAAATTAEQLGAAPLAAEVDALARRARIDLVTTRPADPAQAHGLTPREAEVLRRLAEGRTNADIAADLYISPKTASVHVSNILRKLDVNSRQEAIATAYRAGLIHSL